MVAREDLIQSLEADGNAEFLGLVEKHHARADPFDFEEVIASLDRKQLSEVWQKLQMKCTITLLSFETEHDEEDQDLGEASKVLQGIVVVAAASVHGDKPVIVPELLETVVVLHGIVMSLPETETKLSSSIVRLCETWWKRDLEGRGNLADQTLLWLLHRTCDGKPTNADIKRVWNLRQYLTQVDIDHQGAAPLKAALLTVIMSPNYVKVDEGRRFLAFLFTLKVSFVEELHKTIKNQLPQCKKSLQELYGEVYFRAWRAAEGPVKEKVEHFCIQDLMYLAVHAPRGASHSLFSVLRYVLSHLHKQKAHPGVDQLLLRLYQPILWRSLKVANAHVRANAAALLCDVFPLRDPDANAEEGDSLLQRQIDALQTLLYDVNSTVRAVVVRGVCLIVTQFWEFLPTATISWFLNRLVSDLAWDAASPEVRASVIEGLGRILDNHLSLPLLKVLLPELHNLLHDNSETVRVAFLDLLLKVKGIRAIKFWTVAPMEHLLARLEADSSAVRRRIISLVFYSFMPTDKPVDTQLARCVTLLQTNAGAARWFYRYAHEKMPLVNTVKFMTAVCRCVLLCVRREAAEDGAESRGDAGEEEDEEEEKENVGGEDGTELSASNTDVMAGLLETVVILWEGVKDRLKKPGNTDLKDRLQLRFSQALPEFYRAFSDPRVSACLTLLAGFLPPNNIPTFSRSTLSKLRSLEAESDPSVYSPMLESMCQWGKGADVLDLVNEWFEATLVVKKDDDTANTTLNKSRKKGGVKFAEPVLPRPELAVCYTRYLLRSTVCQQTLLSHHLTPLSGLTRTLSTVTTCIEQRLQSAETLSDHATDEVLLETFDLYCRLEILLHDPEKGRPAVGVVEHLLTWAEAELLLYLRHRRPAKRRLLNQTNMTLLADADSNATSLGATSLGTTLNATLSTTLGGSKRTAGEAHAPAVVQLATRLVKTLLAVTTNMLLVGVADHELLTQLANFSEALLKTEESALFLEQLSGLLYQITELSVSWAAGGEEPDEGVGNDVVPGMLTGMVHTVSTLCRTRKEQAERVLPTLRPVVGQILQAYYRHHNLNQTVSGHVMSTVMAAMVAEMTETIKQEPEFEKCDKVSSLPLLTAFLLSTVGRRKHINSLLVGQVVTCVGSGAVDHPESLLAVLHLLYALCHNLPHMSEFKDSLTAVQTRLEAQQLPDDLLEDSPLRSMHATSKQLLVDCMNRVGMVA